MIDRIRKYIKQFRVKWILKTKYGMMRPLEDSLNDNEKTCLSICRCLIRHQDSKFLIAPLSGKRYIKNSTLDLFVILDDRRVSLTNHIYHYDVKLPEREWDRLESMYDNKTEKIRIDLENQIKSQINHSLSTILDKVNKSFEN
jgi:hypothetical protein